MERFLTTSAMHPMARFIMESDLTDPYESTFHQMEEKNLMSLLLIYIEGTTKNTFRNPLFYNDAIQSLQDLLVHLNDFSSVQNLLAANQVNDETLNKVWESDGFFLISPVSDKVFYEQDIVRKNVCLTTLKKRIERLSSSLKN